MKTKAPSVMRVRYKIVVVYKFRGPGESDRVMNFKTETLRGLRKQVWKALADATWCTDFRTIEDRWAVVDVTVYEDRRRNLGSMKRLFTR